MFHFGLVLVITILQFVPRQLGASPLQHSPEVNIVTSHVYIKNGYHIVVNNDQVIRINPASFNATIENVNLTGTMQLTTWLPGLFYSLKDAKVLDLSNNSIARVPKNGFEEFYKLESLNLSNNQLGHLEGTPFANLGTLKHLDLTNNQIQKLQPGNFFGLSEKTNIFILGNNVTSINRWAFEDPDTYETIDDYTRYRTITETYSMLSQKAKACIREGTLEKVEKLMANETLEEHCYEVTIIGHQMIMLLDGLGIREFSTGWYQLQDYSVPRLSLRNNNIDDRFSDILNKLPKEFYSVDFTGNKIKRLTKGSILNLNLRLLKFTNNSITKVEDGTFEGLNLTHLVLRDNRLNNAKFVASLPSSLKSLDISKNQIRELYPDMFSKFENLQELDLSGNSISEIKNNYLHGLYKVNYLRLADNKIRKIEPGSFNNISSLLVLDLQKNNLANLQVGTFKSIEFIGRIDLSFNNFTRVARDYFPDKLIVSVLNFSHNQIEVLENGAFLMDFAIQLYLNDNKINKISREAFTLKCNVIDLSNNVWSQPDGQVFAGISKMEKLYLQNNGIQHIQKGFAEHLDNLYELNLSSNPIRRLENGALFGIRRSNYTEIKVHDTPLELIQGGLFQK